MSDESTGAQRLAVFSAELAESNDHKLVAARLVIAYTIALVSADVFSIAYRPGSRLGNLCGGRAGLKKLFAWVADFLAGDSASRIARPAVRRLLIVIAVAVACIALALLVAGLFEPALVWTVAHVFPVACIWASGLWLTIVVLRFQWLRGIRKNALTADEDRSDSSCVLASLLVSVAMATYEQIARMKTYDAVPRA